VRGREGAHAAVAHEIVHLSRSLDAPCCSELCTTRLRNQAPDHIIKSSTIHQGSGWAGRGEAESWWNSVVRVHGEGEVDRWRPHRRGWAQTQRQ
jgi:hypothetical protein